MSEDIKLYDDIYYTVYTRTEDFSYHTIKSLNELVFYLINRNLDYLEPLYTIVCNSKNYNALMYITSYGYSPTQEECIEFLQSILGG